MSHSKKIIMLKAHQACARQLLSLGRSNSTFAVRKLWDIIVGIYSHPEWGKNALVVGDGVDDKTWESGQL